MCNKCISQNYKCDCDCPEDLIGWYIDNNGWEIDFCTKCNHEFKNVVITTTNNFINVVITATKTIFIFNFK
jgi:hypothetical protein